MRFLNLKRTIFLMFFGASALFLSPASAQMPTRTESPDTPACPPVAWMCPYVKDEGIDLYNRHTYSLSGSALPVTGATSGRPVPIYIVSGIETTDDTLLTTGNRQTDVQYCLATQQEVDSHTDALTKLINLFGYEIRYLDNQNPFYAENNGTATVKIKPQTIEEEAHTFFMMWPLETEVVDGQGGTNNEQSHSPSYATFRFQNQPAACLSFRADPFGRVYNQQLRPVPGSTVTLFNADTQQEYDMPGVPNPVTTREDGAFNFNIQPGTVSLRTNLANNLNVPANYTLAYTSPYTYGESILETLEKAEQRDIPVTGGNQPILKLMNFGHVQLGNQARIEGNASWPLTMVDIMQGSISLANQQSSKFGRFSFFINNDLIDPTQQLIIRLTEFDLLTNSVNPAGKSVEEKIDPIPRYLEGYAYDAQGNLMPFATVQVKLMQSDAVYHQTTADTNAYFTVAPRDLPILPYYVSYTAANSVPTAANSRKTPVTVFATENKAYHEQNRISIMGATKNGRAIDPGAVLENAENQGAGGQGGNTTTEERSRLQNEQATTEAGEAEKVRQRNLTMFLLIVSFIFVGGGVVVYLKKRGDMPSPHDIYSKKPITRGRDEPELEI